MNSRISARVTDVVLLKRAQRTTIRSMGTGKTKRARQPAIWLATTELPTAASHPV